MRSFLGVPIVSGDEVIGSFYLTDKTGERGAVFTDRVSDGLPDVFPGWDEPEFS